MNGHRLLPPLVVRAAILQPARGAGNQRLPQLAWGGNPDPGGIKGSWIRLTEAGQCVVCHGGDSKVFPSSSGLLSGRPRAVYRTVPEPINPGKHSLGETSDEYPRKSGRHDSNVRPLRPERSALARLSYAPIWRRPQGPPQRKSTQITFPGPGRQRRCSEGLVSR